MQTPKAGTWIETIERHTARPVDTVHEWENHCAWWTNFWDRSWIIASDRTLPLDARERFNGVPSLSGSREEEDGAALAAQSHNVFRLLMACQSRGRVQTKFNEGLFTRQARRFSAGHLSQPGLAADCRQPTATVPQCAQAQYLAAHRGGVGSRHFAPISGWPAGAEQ